jgi:hypothetical protein
VGPRTGLDDVERRKLLLLLELELRSPVVARRYTDCTIPAPERRWEDMKLNIKEEGFVNVD